MDKSWIAKDRDSLEYEMRVEQFLIFDEENSCDPKKIPCPCSRCVNFKKYPVKIIRGHLYEYGFSLGYVDWIWHKEESRTRSVVDSNCRGPTPVPAAPVASASETVNVCDVAYNSGDYDNESYEFRRFLADAEQPLFDGSECTKLESMLKLHNWKARFGISDSAFTDLLFSVGSLLPKETPEHSGRVRGVGSFVSPSVFFNIPNGKRCRITKAELLARDRERDEELKKAKQDMAEEIEKTRKEMAELKTMLKSNVSSPMLSDKASCDSKAEDAQKAKPEKTKPTIAKNLLDDDVAIIEYAAVPPENKGPKKCELAVETIENKVAFGLLFDDEDMNKSIHGVALQPGCARVSVDGAIQGDALIPIPIKGEIETVDQAVGSYVSWPRDLIILPNAPVVEKKKRKEKEPKTELEKVQRLFKSVEINKKVPQRFRLLYKHATTFMKSSGGSIQMPCDAEVFGAEKTIFILAENIIALLEFQMIGQGALSAYMAYLHTVVHDNDELEMYAFCDPATIFTNSTDIERNLVNRLKEGNPDWLFLLPYNTNCHWILVIFWAGEIFVLNPLPRGTNFPELEKALTRAMITFNVQAGRGNKAPSIKYMPGCPKQPGGIECGYVVMRYIREIIMDHELSFLKKWALKTRKLICSEAELDEVRFEALSHIESFM